MEKVKFGSEGASSQSMLKRSSCGLGLRLLVRALCVLALVFSAPVSATSYVYDVNGRLIAVTNDAGESARYVYDVMGNLKQVERLASSELALFAFSPGRGVSGTQVRLQGQGFSTDPGANAVSFAGVAATVVRATRSDLEVIVPVGATTGPISITVGTQTAVSGTDFTVNQNAQLPSIDQVSPLVVAAGDTVTVQGGALYPVEHQTTARIGTRAGIIGSVSNTQLDFKVPQVAASGRVSVSTPYGMANSNQDLLVVPPGVNAADIATLRRIVPDAPATALSIQSTGQQVAILFDAASGEHLDVQFSAISAGHLNYSLYDPSNRNILNGVVDVYSPTALLPPAAGAGTYLLLIRPVQGPATWNLAIERSRKIVPGGDSLPVATTVAGQKKRLVFQASADQRLGLGLSDLSVTPDSGLYAYVYHRDVSVSSTVCYPFYQGCQLNVRALSGTHTVVLAPTGNNETFRTNVFLSDDQRTTLQRNVPVDLDIPRAGQNARLLFSAQAGESLALQVVGQTTVPVGRYVTYAVYRPDGTLHASATVLNQELLNLPSLPQSGQYFVFVDSDYGATLDARIILREGGGSGGQVDGDIGEFETEYAGQALYFTFDVTEVDQRLGLGISDLELSQDSYVSVAVYRPDGAYLSGATCYVFRGGCDANIRAPMVGRYSVVVQPVNAGQTMRLKAWVSTDMEAQIGRETPLQLDVARRGQNARLYFDAQAGETLALQIAAQTAQPTGAYASYQIYNPDGTLRASGSVLELDTLRLHTLAATGRYMVFIDPGDGSQLQSRITLTTGKQTGLMIDGASGDFVAPVSGHPAFLTFVTTVPDQRLGLALGEMQLSDGYYASAALYGPTGEYVTGASCYAGPNGCDMNIRATAVGTYSLVVTPQSSGQLIRFKATLTNDKVLPLVREQPLALEIARRGQNARLRFNAEAGENLALQVFGQATSTNAHVQHAVYGPDGAAVTSMTPIAFGEARMMRLPLSGEYFVFVDPYQAATVQAQVLLTAGNGGAPELDGESGTVDAAQPGQATFTTFTVDEPDQRLGIGISDLVLGAGYYASVGVYAPDGSYVTGATCYESVQGCDLNIRAPVVGTYAVIVTPQEPAQTLKYNITISSDLRRSLPRETALQLNVPRRGQNARLSFTAQAGETLGLKIDGQTTVPLNNTVSYQVYAPDGTWVSSRTTASFETFALSQLPASGEYLLFIDPIYGSAMSVQLTLTDGKGSGAEIDGAPGEFSSPRPGQPTYMTFQAAAGERLGLGISDLVVSDGYYFSVTVYRPGGATAVSENCYVSSQGCMLAIDAIESGTYSVVTTPQSPSQETHFKVTLSRDLRMTLEPDAPLDLTINRRGQRARLSFDGQAGDAVALQVAGQSSLPANATAYYRVYKPDGSLLGTLSTSTFEALELRLPESGTYQVLVNAIYGETLNSRVTLASGTALVVDGTSAQRATAVGGQAVRATFHATAGQSVAVGLHDLVVSSGYYALFAIYRPDGTLATSTYCYTSQSGCKLSVNAAQAGTYSVAVTPQYADQTLSFSLAVSNDMVGELVLDQPLQLSLMRRGQNARLTFNGQAGQWLSLQIAGQTTSPAGATIYYQVYAPDGSYVGSVGTGSHDAIRLPALPVTGQYTVRVDPPYGETLSTLLTLASGNSTLALDGSSAMVATTAGGQEAYVAFAASEGQRIGVGLRDLQVSTGSYFSAVVFRPDGSSTSVTCQPYYDGCKMNFIANATGIYRLYAWPQQGDQKIGFTVTASTDLEAMLERGVRLPLVLSRPGRNAVLSFAGTAGEQLSLHVDAQLTEPVGTTVYYSVYRPDGTFLTSSGMAYDTTLQLPLLPVDGTYKVVVDASFGATLEVGMTLR